MIKLIKQWDSQPQGAIQLAPEWADRVVALILPQALTRDETLAGTALPLSVSQRGVGVAANGAGLYYKSFDPGEITSGIGLSLVVVGSISTTGNADQAGLGENIATGGFFNLTYNTTLSSPGFRFRGRFGGGITSSAPTLTTGLRSKRAGNFVGRIRSATLIDVYIDGQDGLAASDSTSGSDNPLWSRAAVGGMMRDTGIYASAPAAFELLAAVKGTTQYEALSLSANPWQLFEPQRIWVPVSTTASGNYTVTADSGTYSVTGHAATLLRNKVVSADHGTYSVSGQTASIYRNKVLSASHGTYSVSGQNASLFKTRIVTAEVGSYSLTGQNATITKTSTSANYTITANVGTYTLSGQSAAILKSKVVNAAQGTYSVAGKNATIAYSGANTIVLKAGSWLRYRIIQ